MIIYSWFTYYKMVIFYSYVSLPEGTPLKNMSQMGVLFPIYGKNV